MTNSNLFFLFNYFGYTQSPIVRTGRIRLDPEILEKFKTRALGSSNLRTTSKNLRTASVQIFKTKNQFLDESIVELAGMVQSLKIWGDT